MKFSSPDEERKTRRFEELRDWMRSLGCCVWCSMGMAIAAVEKEEGAAYDWKAIRGRCDLLIRPARVTCEQAARAAWPSRPKRPTPLVPPTAPRATGGLRRAA